MRFSESLKWDDNNNRKKSHKNDNNKKKLVENAGKIFIRLFIV